MKKQPTSTTRWSAARERWGDDRLMSPWARLVAMVAAGQLMRMGVDATGVFAPRRVANTGQVQNNKKNSDGTVITKHPLFFHTREQLDTVEPPLLPTGALVKLRDRLDPNPQPAAKT
jgi:hypothetical protein